MEIGVISDTHGLLRPEAVAALDGVDAILHGGDVGEESILDRLAEIAPVTAVRGNIDVAPWCDRLPLTAEVEFDGIWVHMRHIREELDLDLRAGGFRLFVFGHSHQPLEETRNGVLWLNPGSAGPRRFRLPVTLARLSISQGEVRSRIVELLP